MITEYSIYIKENSSSVIDKFITDKYHYLTVDAKYFNTNSKIYIMDKYNEDNIVIIDNNINSCIVLSPDSILTEFNYINYYDLIEQLNLILEKYYELLKLCDKTINILKSNANYILCISVLDVEKYVEYVVYCALTYNIKILEEFNACFLQQNKYDDIKKCFYSKYKYLLDAKNFDLI